MNLEDEIAHAASSGTWDWSPPAMDWQDFLHIGDLAAQVAERRWREQLQPLRDAVADVDAAAAAVVDDPATLGRAVVALVDAEDAILAVTRALLSSLDEEGEK